MGIPRHLLPRGITADDVAMVMVGSDECRAEAFERMVAAIGFMAAMEMYQGIRANVEAQREEARLSRAAALSVH